jgi:PAS domain S-box-containing protein
MSTDRIRVLLVEDNPTDKLLVEDELTHAGHGQFSLAHVELLNEALHQLKAEPFDVVLLDLSLPDSHGFETFVRLHDAAKEVPIVVLSGGADGQLAVQAVQAGAQDYLMKGRLGENVLPRSIRYAIERQRADRNLVESQERYRLLIQRSPDAYLIVCEDKIVFANAASLNLFAADREASLLGQSFLEIVAPEFRNIVRERIQNALGDGVNLPIEILVTRLDGTVVSVEKNSNLFVHGGKPAVQIVLRDITERKQGEARLRGQEEAERANRAKSEFLSRISHELRTPLHAILGFAQLLEMDDLNVDDKESVGHIVKAGKHLLGLINEVLDIARVESGKLALTPEPVSVRDTLLEALSLVKPLAAERRVRLAPLAGDFDCEVLSSEQRFKQVILNLLSNAVKFNRNGGTVTVSCVKIADYLRISVADTGRGVSPANLAKLFVPFERLEIADTVIEGTGLGLSLSKHLIEAMGGRIGVESVLGEGTTFWVELPLVQATPAATEQKLDAPLPNPAERPPGSAPVIVLYIEDNLSNLRLLERILARRPEVQLISAMQGSTGLELSRQHQPDLVLLDLHLPDMQGDEILRQLRGDPRMEKTPIVMISADATAPQIERLMAAGATDYLTKPIDVHRFLAVVDAIPPRERASASPAVELTLP